LTSGGLINLDTLGVGAHTIVVTATDALGNVSSQTITFQIHATVTGLINAVNEGASRGLITASEAAVLVSELQSALKGNSGKTKISQSLSMVQSASGGSINAAYAALLIAWANDPLLTFK
ncbi:MAG: hypothetical protein ACXVZ2_12890, partial [Gaiellaceae bacterium]